MKKAEDHFGVTCIDSQILFPVGEDTVSLRERSWDMWERLRRNKEYQNLCKDVEFHPSGLVGLKWSALNRDKFFAINKSMRERFGIETFFDPKKPFWELTPGSLETWGVAPLAVKLIAHDKRLGYDNEEQLKERFIENDKYISVKIDITQPISDIIKLLMPHIDEQRKIIGVEPKKIKTRFKEWMDAYEIFDLKNENYTDIEIIKKWPGEYEDCQRKDAKKSEEKFHKLSDTYRKAGHEDWEERAYNETYDNNPKLNTLYQRVTDKFNSASKRISEITQI